MKVWWEAKEAKEKNNLGLAVAKLKSAISLLESDSIKKISNEEILEIVGAAKHPIVKGKLQPPQNGAYTGVWLQVFCTKNECPKGTFDQLTKTHSALVFDVAPWYAPSAAFDYDFAKTIEKARYFSWDNLFSFEDSILVNTFVTNIIGGKKLPLVLTYKQYVELLAQYGSAPTIAWIAGYEPSRAGAGDQDYQPLKLADHSPKIQDILDGKWDNYIKKIANEIKNINAPLLLELTHEFNVNTFSTGAFWSFGKNGDKSSFGVCNPALPEQTLKDLFKDLNSLVDNIKSGKIKSGCLELYNQYQSQYIFDKNHGVPDGAERQRDLWIHVKKIFDNEGVGNVAWFEHTGDSFGTELVNMVLPWNKIDYFWPGPGVLDFLGTSAYYQNTESASNKYSAPDDNRSFHAAANLAKEAANSFFWKDTPILLVEFTYMQPQTEEKNIERIFGQYLPQDLKNVKGFTFGDWPPTFDTPQEIQAWQKNVSQNPYYIQYPVIK